MAPKNARHRMFCKLYLAGDHPFNGTKTYLALYPKANRKTAMSNASKLVRRFGDYLDALFEQSRSL